MPRKSTKDVVSNINVAPVADNTSPLPVNELNTKKRAPVKRENKKMNTLSTPTMTSSSSSSSSSTIEKNILPIQLNDSINTFNINIKHISDDGNDIENTFSTTYTHKSENNNMNGRVNTSSDSSNSSDENDSDEDSDYDKRFANSSLTLPLSSNSINTTLLGQGSGSCEDTNPLYNTQQINYDILIPFVLVNMHASSRENIMALLHTTLISCIEGRCITEGFIKPESTRIIDFKCGKIIAKNVQFNIVIECLVCNPQPQSIITCVAKNITQAGIRAVYDDEYSPIVVYITRDFGIDSDKTYYNSIKEGDKINIRVIGKRFEMNDKHIQIIGFLVQPKKERVTIGTPSSNSQTQVKKAPLEQSAKTPASAPPSAPPASTTTTHPEKKQESTSTIKRGPRKIKNPLSIINDTDNNVITITYDASIELPKEPKTKSKAPKEPKTSKKSKKENSANAENAAIPIVEICD
jgi:hypothetical protein